MRTGSPAASVSGRPSPSSSTGFEPCHVVAGSTTRTSRACWACTTTGAATLRMRVRASKMYSPDLPPGAEKCTTRERVPRPRSRIWRSPTRRTVQVKFASPELTATAARSPAPTGSASGCALR